MAGDIFQRVALLDDDVVVGRQLQASDSQGNQIVLTVTALDDTTVTLDANHPLAGENLTFDVELLEIVASTA